MTPFAPPKVLLQHEVVFVPAPPGDNLVMHDGCKLYMLPWEIGLDEMQHILRTPALEGRVVQGVVKYVDFRCGAALVLGWG